MKLVFLNVLFLAGCSAVVRAAFLVSESLGFFVLGIPLIMLSVHEIRQSAKHKGPAAK